MLPSGKIQFLKQEKNKKLKGVIALLKKWIKWNTVLVNPGLNMYNRSGWYPALSKAGTHQNIWSEACIFKCDLHIANSPFQCLALTFLLPQCFNLSESFSTRVAAPQCLAKTPLMRQKGHLAPRHFDGAVKPKWPSEPRHYFVPKLAIHSAVSFRFSQQRNMCQKPTCLFCCSSVCLRSLPPPQPLTVELPVFFNPCIPPHFSWSWSALMVGAAKGKGRVLRLSKPRLAGDEVMLCSINRDAVQRMQFVSMPESFSPCKGEHWPMKSVCRLPRQIGSKQRKILNRDPSPQLG